MIMIITGNCTAGREPTNGQRTTSTDQTSMRLFFQLLHKARMLKQERRNPIINKAVLIGMRWVLIENAGDFRIADNMRDYWKHQNAGAKI